MISKIPFKRQVLYLLILAQVPLLLVFFHFLSERQTVHDLSNTLELLQENALLREQRQAVNNAVRSHYREADHFYIDKNLQILAFLEKEVENLQKVVGHRNFTEDNAIKKRLEFLT